MKLQLCGDTLKTVSVNSDNRNAGYKTEYHILHYFLLLIILLLIIFTICFYFIKYQNKKTYYYINIIEMESSNDLR